MPPPNYVPAYFHAGQTLERLSRIEDARAVYVRGIEVAGRTGNAHARSELQAASCTQPERQPPGKRDVDAAAELRACLRPYGTNPGAPGSHRRRTRRLRQRHARSELQAALKICSPSAAEAPPAGAIRRVGVGVIWSETSSRGDSRPESATLGDLFPGAAIPFVPAADFGLLMERDPDAGNAHARSELQAALEIL